jgi:hypothetical protein
MGNPNWKRGGPSPNPAGKPKGAYSKRDKIAHALNDNGPDVVQKVIDAALAGDMTACGLVLTRLVPTVRAQAQTVQFALDTGLPLSEQLAQLALAVAAGQVSPDTGQQISAMLSNLATVRSSENLEERIIALEARAVNT